MSRHTVRLTQTGRLCLIGHSEGVPPDLCCHTNYQSASTRTLHWHSGWHRGIAPLSEAEPGPPNCAGTPLQRTDIFFFVRSSGRRLRQVWAPTAPQLARVPRCATRPTASDPPASHVLPAARAGAALCKCGVAVQPGHGGQH